MLALGAHLPRLLHRGIPGEKHRGGIAVTRGLEQLQLLNEGKVHLLQGQGQVVFLFGNEAMGIAVFRNGQGKPALELRHQRRVHGQPRRLLMAAKALEQVLALGEHRMDIHPGNGPAGAHRRIAATAQHHRGPVVPFANAPCRQPYNAAVPAFSHHHNGLVPGKIHLPADCFQHLLGYLLLQGLARAVVFLQMRGDALRLLVIRGCKQPDTLGRVLQPAAGIEARRQAKAHMAGIHRRSYPR